MNGQENNVKKINHFIYLQHNFGNNTIYIFLSKTNDDYIYAGSSGVHEIKLFNLKDG